MFVLGPCKFQGGSLGQPADTWNMKFEGFHVLRGLCAALHLHNPPTAAVQPTCAAAVAPSPSHTLCTACATALAVVSLASEMAPELVSMMILRVSARTWGRGDIYMCIYVWIGWGRGGVGWDGVECVWIGWERGGVGWTRTRAAALGSCYHQLRAMQGRQRPSAWAGSLFPLPRLF